MRVGPTGKIPQGADLIDLVRGLLEAEGVAIDDVQTLENGNIGVVLCPPARAFGVRAVPQSSQDPRSELLQKFYGIDLVSLKTPRPSSQGDTWRNEIGKWANQRLKEGSMFAKLVRSRKKAEVLRDQFPEFFSEVVDKLRPPRRGELFEKAERFGMTAPELMVYIAEPKGIKGTTLSDYRKEYRSHASIGRRRRAPDSSPKKSPQKDA